jgi:hypothetical protein
MHVRTGRRWPRLLRTAVGMTALAVAATTATAAGSAAAVRPDAGQTHPAPPAGGLPRADAAGTKLPHADATGAGLSRTEAAGPQRPHADATGAGLSRTDAAGAELPRAVAGALLRPAADQPERRGVSAPIRGEVAGATGAAAARLAGEAATRFEELTRRRVGQARAAGSGALAELLHTAWGTAFNQPQAKGIRATHSVLSNPAAGTTTRGGEYIYSPTAMSPGGACMEITTAYTPNGQLLWAWDWCGGRSRVGKAVSMDAAFLATYTTTVNGLPAYSFEVSQTNPTGNVWTGYLYNFKTHAYETFYTSSGTYDLDELWFGWDIFEIYSAIDPATGIGYYCTGMKAQTFDASAVEVKLNGSWATATAANSSGYGNPPQPAKGFQCPSLTFTMVSPNNHWTAKIPG